MNSLKRLVKSRSDHERDILAWLNGGYFLSTDIVRVKNKIADYLELMGLVQEDKPECSMECVVEHAVTEITKKLIEVSCPRCNGTGILNVEYYTVNGRKMVLENKNTICSKCDGNKVILEKVNDLH